MQAAHVVERSSDLRAQRGEVSAQSSQLGHTTRPSHKRTITDDASPFLSDHNQSKSSQLYSSNGLLRARARSMSLSAMVPLRTLTQQVGAWGKRETDQVKVWV